MARVKAKARAAQRQRQIDSFEGAAGRLVNRPDGFTTGANRIVRNARRRGTSETSEFDLSAARRRLRARPEAGPFTAALNQVQANQERRRNRRIRG